MTPTNRCLDGETLAAWVDGGLSRDEAAMAEAHVSSCPRCQEIAGLIVKTTPATVVNAPWWRRRAAWLIPATVGVTAAGLLMIAPADPTQGPAAPTVTVPTVTAPPATAALESMEKAAAAAVAPVAPPAETAPAPTTLAEAKKERKREEQAANAAASVAAAPAPAPSAATPSAATPSAATAPPPVASERSAAEQARQPAAADQLARQTLAQAADRAAVSPDGALHWRITDRGALERSTDGTSWQAVNVGVIATFSTVQAPEPRAALVRTTDGRVFRTVDGGATWKLVPPSPGEGSSSYSA